MKKKREGKPSTSSQAPAKRSECDDDLLTLAEVLHEFRHRKSWLFDQIDNGLITPGYKIGKRRLWLKREIREARDRLLTPVAPKKGSA